MEHIFEAPRRASRPRRRRAARAPRKVAAAQDRRAGAPACQGRRGRSRHRARRSGREAGRQAHPRRDGLAAGTSAKASTKAATKTASKTTTPTAAKSAAPANPPTTRPSRNEPAVLHALRQAHRPRPDAVGRALRHRPSLRRTVAVGRAGSATWPAAPHPGRTGTQDPRHRRAIPPEPGRRAHRRRAAQPRGRRDRRGAGARRRGQPADEGQPAHRRTHARGRRTQHRAAQRRINHVFIMEVPTYPEPLFITDAAINIFPTWKPRPTSSAT